MPMGKHLRFDYMHAVRYKEGRHAQVVMKQLGVTYQHCTPQGLVDMFVFWNCENIPDVLPPFIRPYDQDPMEMIGYGLTQAEAEMIREYQPPLGAKLSNDQTN